jgi:hypothetical protein
MLSDFPGWFEHRALTIAEPRFGDHPGSAVCLPAPRNAPHGRTRFPEMSVGFRSIRGPFPTHNPTHILRCLVGLLRLLAVPAVL